jgi:hypothetical protein
VKSSEEIMEILEAFDLTGGLRAAATLVGCDHKTVAHYVALRDAGMAPDQRAQRLMLIDEFLDKVEEWVDRSRAVQQPSQRSTRHSPRFADVVSPSLTSRLRAVPVHGWNRVVRSYWSVGHPQRPCLQSSSEARMCGVWTPV